MKQWGAIFDLDGVLIDSSAFHLASWQRLGQERGFVMTEEIFWETFGMPNRQIFARLFGEPLPEDEAQALSERKEALYRKAARGRLRPLPGVAPLLQSLQAAGFGIALGSSTPRSNIEVIFASLNIAPMFDATVCANDVTHGKPHPEVFLKAAERIQAPPEHCVVIEDAVVGIQAAKAAAMRCLAVTTTHPRERLSLADRVVDSLREVDASDFMALLSSSRAL